MVVIVGNEHYTNSRSNVNLRKLVIAECSSSSVPGMDKKSSLDFTQVLNTGSISRR
jgi:hypothetical protein